MKKKRRNGKQHRTQEAKVPAADREKKGAPEAEGQVDDFGGMNLSGFWRNLGCGG